MQSLRQRFQSLQMDKKLHFMVSAYLALFIFVLMDVKVLVDPLPTGSSTVSAVFIPLFIGALWEFVRGWNADSPKDMGANAAGVLLSVLVWHWAIA